MDIISHALWGATVVRKKHLVWWAVLVGAAPDLLSNGVAFFYLLIAHSQLWSASTWPLLPSILKNAYNVTHSIVGVAIVAGLFFLFWKRYMILVIPYVLHVAMDLFAHEGNVINRLLFPFQESTIAVYGLNWWEQWWIWWINVALLVVVNFIFFIKEKSVIQRRKVIKNSKFKSDEEL